MTPEREPASARLFAASLLVFATGVLLHAGLDAGRWAVWAVFAGASAGRLVLNPYRENRENRENGRQPSPSARAGVVRRGIFPVFPVFPVSDSEESTAVDSRGQHDPFSEGE